MSRPNFVKLFMAVIYECLQLARVFVPGKPFHQSLMFASKAGAFQSEAPLKSSTFTNKLWNRLERPTRDKDSSLLRTSIIYGSKRFYNVELRGQCYKTFYGRNLQVFAISKCLSFTSLSSLWVRLEHTLDWSN